MGIDGEAAGLRGFGTRRASSIDGTGRTWFPRIMKWGALVVASVLGLACGGSSETATPDASTNACVPNQSIACVGPGGCAGGQACKSDGTAYSPCDCGSHPDAGPNDGGPGDSGPGTDSGGTDAAVADGGPLSPDQIPGLSLWLDSSKGTTPDLVHPPLISLWADQSGHGNNAKNSAYQQAPGLTVSGYKSFDIISFGPGTMSVIDDDASLRFGTGAFALVEVLREPLANAGTTPIWSKPNAALGFYVTLDQAITATTPSATVAALLTNPTTFHVVAIRGPALEIRVDGVTTKGTSSSSDISQTGVQVWFGALGPDRVEYLQVIAYKGAVSDLQMTGLETYLATKYGL